MTEVGSLIDCLTSIVGRGRVHSDPELIARLSSDYSLESSIDALIAVRPGRVDELPEVVRCCASQGVGLTCRGGGMSYTLAHTPARATDVLIDLRDLTAVEVDARDMVATVEAGCTWEQLLLALEPHGLRTPFWGPLSGRRSTVGGTLSQNALFYGSARYGTAVESVLGLDVVLADGTRVVTGSAARRGGRPFTRAFGPDLTGLFLSDSGAFGIKVRAALALVPSPTAASAATFAVAGAHEAAACIEAIARLGVASEIFAFDSFYHSLLGRLGMTYLCHEPWSVNAVVEAADEACLEACIDLVRRTGLQYGREIPASAPLAMRFDPFGATQLMFEALEGKVHLPLHGAVPYSRADAAIQAIAAVILRRQDALAAHDIRTWMLINATRNVIVIEPTMYFSGDYRGTAHDAAARKLAVGVRHELTEALDAVGAVHMQLGKYYSYLPALQSGTAAAVQSIKAALDPDRMIAPGVLGL